MSAITKIKDFVFEKMVDEPIDRRIELSLALAALSEDPAEMAGLKNHVEMLREIDAHHRQLLLNFRSRNHAAA